MKMRQNVALPTIKLVTSTAPPRPLLATPCPLLDVSTSRHRRLGAPPLFASAPPLGCG